MTCWLWRFPWPIGFCWMSNRRPHFVIAAVFTCLISGVVSLAVYTSWVIFTGEVITAVLICLPQCSQAFGLLQLRVLCPVFHQLLQCHTIGFHIYFSTRIIIIKYNHIHWHWNTWLHCMEEFLGNLIVSKVPRHKWPQNLWKQSEIHIPK